MTLSTKIEGKIKFSYIAAVGGTNTLYQPEIDLADSLATGVTLDKGDLLYVAKAVALSGSATTNLDVSGSLSDAFGATLAFVKIKLFYFRNLNTTAGNTITLGGNANAFLLFGTGSHTHTVGPDGRLFIFEPSLAGKAVTASTGDILDIVNDTANNVTYDIAIVGTSS